MSATVKSLTNVEKWALQISELILEVRWTAYKFNKQTSKNSSIIFQLQTFCAVLWHSHVFWADTHVWGDSFQTKCYFSIFPQSHFGKGLDYCERVNCISLIKEAEWVFPRSPWAMSFLVHKMRRILLYIKLHKVPSALMSTNNWLKVNFDFKQV